MDYDLGYIDLEERSLQPLEKPFGPKSVTYVSGSDSLNSGAERGT